MTDDLPIATTLRPSLARPLAGLTVLVVEDSRYASEAIRLLCLRSGARVRRADCLHSARRHLMVYRPSVVIVDLGLPDGSGADLISEIAGVGDGLPSVLGLSGDPGGEVLARAAGASGFLPKPVIGLAAFQHAVLSALPEQARPRGVHPVSGDEVEPDPVSLAEDLLNASDLLSEAQASGEFAYLAHFLRGVALTARDTELGDVADVLARDGIAARDRLADVLGTRLRAQGGV